MIPSKLELGERYFVMHKNALCAIEVDSWHLKVTRHSVTKYNVSANVLDRHNCPCEKVDLHFDGRTSEWYITGGNRLYATPGACLTAHTQTEIQC